MSFSEFIRNCKKYPQRIRYKGTILFVSYKQYKKLSDFALKWELNYKDVRYFLKKEGIYLDKSFSENSLFISWQKGDTNLLINNVDLVLSGLDKNRRVRFFQGFLKREFLNLIVLPVLIFQDEANKGYEQGHGRIFSLGGENETL